MAAMAKGDAVRRRRIRAPRGDRRFMSKLPLEGFVPGSDTGETKAKPEIWLDMDDFKAKLEKMQAEVAKLAEVAKAAISIPARRSSERPARPARLPR